MRLSALGRAQHTVIGHKTGQGDGIDVVFLDPICEICAVENTRILFIDALVFWFHLGFNIRV